MLFTVKRKKEMKLKFLRLIPTTVCAGLLLIGCGNNQNSIGDLDIDTDDDTIEVNTEHIVRVKKIFYNVPSPIEMATIMQKAGATFDSELLNEVSNIDKYTTISTSAINLGIYGADLSYTRMFDQIQESVNYLSVLRKLSDRLGIPQDEGSFAVERIEENIDNRDSLLYIITDVYSTADLYLKENDRGSTAALIVLGGWAEALYISTNIVKEETPNQEIINRIGEQKFSLENLIELMTAYSYDETIARYLPDLEELKVAFDKIDITNTNSSVETDTMNKITRINSSTVLNVTIDNIFEIKPIINRIRTQMIS